VTGIPPDRSDFLDGSIWSGRFLSAKIIRRRQKLTAGYAKRDRYSLPRKRGTLSDSARPRSLLRLTRGEGKAPHQAASAPSNGMGNKGDTMKRHMEL